MAIISAVMPLYNGKKYIEESLHSILAQTFQNWELIIVSEYGNDDGSEEIIAEYALTDSRIHLIKNAKREGLAQSLNSGIQSARGKYVARVDVDDPSYPERFLKQYKFMENNSDIFLCGALTRSVLPNNSYVLGVPCDYEDLKAGLLFGCEISHCSVMFRREEWISSGYAYDLDSLCEDYDLWTRIMFEKKIANVPEVLVDHRWGFDNISIKKGEKLLDASGRVSRRTISENFGVSLPDEYLYMYSGWRSLPRKIAQNNVAEFLQTLYTFLIDLENANNNRHLIEIEVMRQMLWKRFNWGCECCNLFFEKFEYRDIVHEAIERPKVSIVMPVMNSVFTIRETIDSILQQEYNNWEYIIVCESDTDDGSFEIADYMSRFDKRIRVIRNEKKPGLAQSLNVGVEIANGEYIARIDADDLANAKRLLVQVEFMDSHPQVGICQTDQHYFGIRKDDFTHAPQHSADDLKANLLFFCDACHSTVLFRKGIWDKYNFCYNTFSSIEDYDLWTRFVECTDFVTIPQVLGEYRVSYSNISNEKKDTIQNEMCEITARQLREHLGIDVRDGDRYVLGGYVNVIQEMPSPDRSRALFTLKKVLINIWNSNKEKSFYNKYSLQKAIVKKWLWASEGKNWLEDNNDEIMDKVMNELGIKTSKKIKLRSILLKPLKGIQRMNLHLFAKCIEHLSNVTKDVSAAQRFDISKDTELWTWERYKRIRDQLDEIEWENHQLLLHEISRNFAQNRIIYHAGEKVRIVFLYQISSLWISWKSFYEACLNDDRLDCKLLFLDETASEKSQMEGAEEFLVDNNLDYVDFDDFDLDKFAPHYMVIQTPYDKWHRKKIHRSGVFKAQGIRLIYIPYGIEISDTEDSHRLHFEEDTILNSYRIFTFSDRMLFDYKKYCLNKKAVCATGLPRLDFYFHANRSGKKMNKSKTLLWKVHFPKWIEEDGRRVLVTPLLEEYLSFAKWIRANKNIQVMFMPHPKFMEKTFGDEIGAQVKAIVEVLSTSINCRIIAKNDYWNYVLDADYVITDRSSVMVEVASLDIPVMYVSNPSFDEPFTEAIKPLMESYYKATKASEMIEFVSRCLEGCDPLAGIRRERFLECFPLYDGNAGERIKDEIIRSIIRESNQA